MAKLFEYGITDSRSLIKFLEAKGKNHNYYYHYTSWESMEKILSNGTFLLTRGNALCINDQQEAKMKGNYDIWDKTYIASFAFGASENMAMWGLYCKPWSDAVRLCIPKKEMNEWLESIKTISVWKENSETERIEDFNKTLADIVYIYGNKGATSFNLTHGSDHYTVPNAHAFRKLDEKAEMTGYIKNYAWHYENEVRLKIQLNKSIDSEKICVHLPSSVIESITVTTGPNFDWNKSDLLEYLEKRNRIQISGFTQLVNFRDLCDYCNYNFLRNNNE